MDEPKTELLRHTLATLAYRGGKAVRGVPPEVATFRAGPETRTPLEILAHVNDLLDWALTIAEGVPRFEETVGENWALEVARFHRGLAVLDERLAAERALGRPAEKIFQGPIADALHHVGQIALLRRLGGAPQRGENFYVAEIVTGRTGAEQAPPRREFD
ncbi:MAG: hypothetical protein KDB94_13915 [Acidobacteria bacterium]|nr:hypothetical protein [Acidobacteriota bacterium]